jgi:hypothetical protein
LTAASATAVFSKEKHLLFLFQPEPESESGGNPANVASPCCIARTMQPDRRSKTESPVAMVLSFPLGITLSVEFIRQIADAQPTYELSRALLGSLDRESEGGAAT